MKGFAAPVATILLLDSEPLMLSVVREVLEDAGYLVLPAADLGQAVDRLSEMRPDLLITRPYINSMPGRMAADYLRSKRPGLPVLIVAGNVDDERLVNTNAVAQFHTFPKPFPPQELVEKVREVLESTRKKT